MISISSHKQDSENWNRTLTSLEECQVLHIDQLDRPPSGASHIYTPHNDFWMFTDACTTIKEVRKSNFNTISVIVQAYCCIAGFFPNRPYRFVLWTTLSSTKARRMWIRSLSCIALYLFQSYVRLLSQNYLLPR